MIPTKQGTLHLLALGTSLLAVGIVFTWMAFKAPVKEAAQAAPVRHSSTAKQNAHTPKQNLSGNEPHAANPLVASRAKTRTAAKPDAAARTSSPNDSIEIHSVTQMQPDPATAHELRCEIRELSPPISDLYRGDSPPPPERLRFPLFDGESVLLKALRHQPMGTGQGVVFAEADGEPEGGHVLLSYVGNALAGMIHLPSRGEFYEIRTGPDGRSHILTQLDPNKMPVCGGCPQHPAK